MTDTDCSLCGAAHPEFLCLCMEVTVCRKCITQHILGNPSPTHKPLPLDCAELIQAIHDEVAESQQSTRNTDCPERYTERRKTVRRLLLKEISRVQAFKIATEVKMQQAKHYWEQQLAIALASSLESLAHQVDETKKSLTKTLSEVMSSDALLDHFWAEGRSEEEELVDLNCEIKTVDLQAVLRPSLNIGVQYCEERQDSILYKFFGGIKQVGLFEARTESFTKVIPSTLKFFHNSSYSQSASGLVYLTGGSLTGRSRNDAATFNPQSGLVTILQPMQVARRSHASVCVGSACYVFGGLMEDERSSLCEKFTEDQNTWVSIRHMHERRAYLGCCLFQAHIYLCGGAATPSMESFSPSTESFTLLALSEPGLEDNCSLTALSDSFLIFYGSYQGHVMKYAPGDGAVVKMKDMCYGNSWSSCASVVYEKNVYMLRSESVFRYNYETGESAYVLRMSKSAQRGPEL